MIGIVDDYVTLFQVHLWQKHNTIETFQYIV